MTGRRRLLLVATLGACVFALVGVLLARPLGWIRTRMTVAQYLQHARDDSGRSFSVKGTLVKVRPTGSHTERAGVYEVTFAGSEVRDSSGTLLHSMTIADTAGTEAELYYDPARVPVPTHGSLELRGHFETVLSVGLGMPPSPHTFGVVERAILLSGS